MYSLFLNKDYLSMYQYLLKSTLNIKAIMIPKAIQKFGFSIYAIKTNKTKCKCEKC